MTFTPDREGGNMNEPAASGLEERNEDRVKKLMYYANKPDQEQMVWLVWELVNGRAVLAVICTTDEDLSRYVSKDGKTFLGSETPAYCEKVMCDHRFGHGDRSAAIAANLIRRTA